MKNIIVKFSSLLAFAFFILSGCAKDNLKNPIIASSSLSDMNQGPAVDMHISAMTIWGARGPSKRWTCGFLCPYIYDQASVTIVDETASPIEGVVVTGNFTGSYKLLKISATTDASGVARFKGKEGKGGNVETFAVTSVSKIGYNWDFSSDVLDSISYTIPTN